MKLKFKNQAFQEAATAAVCDVFEGQPYHAQDGTDCQRDAHRPAAVGRTAVERRPYHGVRR